MPYGRGLTARGIRSLYVGALRAAEVDEPIYPSGIQWDNPAEAGRN